MNRRSLLAVFPWTLAATAGAVGGDALAVSAVAPLLADQQAKTSNLSARVALLEADRNAGHDALAATQQLGLNVEQVAAYALALDRRLKVVEAKR